MVNLTNVALVVAIHLVQAAVVAVVIHAAWEAHVLAVLLLEADADNNINLN
jgi:hypothetical protein